MQGLSIVFSQRALLGLKKKVKAWILIFLQVWKVGSGFQRSNQIENEAVSQCVIPLTAFFVFQF
jgi:hypothetical protein